MCSGGSKTSGDSGDTPPPMTTTSTSSSRKHSNDNSTHDDSQQLQSKTPLSPTNSCKDSCKDSSSSPLDIFNEESKLQLHKSKVINVRSRNFSDLVTRFKLAASDPDMKHTVDGGGCGGSAVTSTKDNSGIAILGNNYMTSYKEKTLIVTSSSSSGKVRRHSEASVVHVELGELNAGPRDANSTQPNSNVITKCCSVV